MPITGTTVPAIHLPLEDGYVLTGIPNYDGGKTKIPNKRSWWLSRRGWIKAIYCFSTPLEGDAMTRELEHQLTALNEFKSRFSQVICCPARRVKIYMPSYIDFIAEVPDTILNTEQWVERTFPDAKSWESLKK